MIPRSQKSAKALRNYDVIKVENQKNRDFGKNGHQNQNFAIKVLNDRFSSGFLLIKKGNDNSNMPCKFQLHSMHIFFKMAA